MLNFKKLALAVCGMALALSTTILSASAAYDADIVQSTKKAKNDYTYIRLAVPSLASEANADGNNFTLNGTVRVKVQKGLFKDAVVTEISTYDPDAEEFTQNGLQLSTNNTTPTWSIALNTSYSTEFDVIMITWATDVPCYTPTGNVVDVKLTYTDATNKGDAVMSVLADSIISTCDVNGANTSINAAFNANPYVYTLASGTNTITKAEPSAGPTKKVEVAGYFTGDKDEDGDEKDTADVTAAIYAQLIPADANTVYTKVNWSVTATEDGTANSAAKTQEYEQTGLDLSGEAAYKVGLVIRGLAANVITAVDAALAQ